MHKIFYRWTTHHTYWTVIILLLAGVLVYALMLSFTNPHEEPFVAREQAMVRYREEMRPFTREVGRIGDFAFMYNFLYDNWPYFEAAERAGYDVHEIALNAFNLLADEAFYGEGQHFLWNFMEEHFFSQIPALGDLRLVSEAMGLPPWVNLPYFFGRYDWRFTHDNMYVPFAEEPNFSYEISDDVVFARVRSFLPHGYRPGNNDPYWQFDWDNERARVHDFFLAAEGAEDIVIDIRCNADGFYEYFVHMLLSPLATVRTPMTFSVTAESGDFAQEILSAFRQWYGWGESVTMTMDGGWMDANAWVIVCAAAFSGPNHAYIALAQAEGVNIVLDERCDCGNSWGTSFTRLPHSRLTLRFNPLAFRWQDGRLFEEYPAQACYTLDAIPARLRAGLMN